MKIIMTPLDAELSQESKVLKTGCIVAQWLSHCFNCCLSNNPEYHQLADMTLRLRRLHSGGLTFAKPQTAEPSLQIL